MPSQRVYRIRHEETEWSVSGQHAGMTDIPLTENGRRVTKLLKPVLTKETFAIVLKNPLQRARETCELAGLGGCAEVDRDVMEWHYGEYEGFTSQPMMCQRSDPAGTWLNSRHIAASCPSRIRVTVEKTGLRIENLMPLCARHDDADRRLPVAS